MCWGRAGMKMVGEGRGGSERVEECDQIKCDPAD